MSKEKSCKICRTIFEGSDKCPKCGSKETTDSFKGRVNIFNPEKSEIAQKLNIKEKGSFAIKVK
jgi:DNA-directed RNA polymerase subunit E"